MEGKISVDRLSVEEIRYELVIRGGSDIGSAEALRKRLRQYLAAEKDASFHPPKYPYTFVVDIEAIKKSTRELDVLVKDFAGGKGSAVYKKIIAKYEHAKGRLDRCPAVSEEEKTAKSEQLVLLVGIKQDLDEKLHTVKTSTAIGADLELSLNALEGSFTDDLMEDSSGEEGDTICRSKPVPVSSWGIKFSGDTKRLSLHNFLERVHELREARNVSRRMLFRSAVDLFSGQAAVWFRANRKNFDNWKDLEQGLFETFLPPYYEDQLLQEIRHRTQGACENISMYCAVMNTLFSRLRQPVTEALKVKILLKNLAPFYQNQLGLIEVSSVEQLIQLCRRMEDRKATIEAYVPPPRRSQIYEPELSYVSSEAVSCSLERTNSSARERCSPPATVMKDQERSSSGRTQSRNLTTEKPRPRGVCWVCGDKGHLATKCSRKHCFRCFTPDVTVRNCPKCNQGKSGAAR